MKKFLLVSILIINLFGQLSAQNTYYEKFHLTITDGSLYPISEETMFMSSTLEGKAFLQYDHKSRQIYSDSLGASGYFPGARYCFVDSIGQIYTIRQSYFEKYDSVGILIWQKEISALSNMGSAKMIPLNNGNFFMPHRVGGGWVIYSPDGNILIQDESQYVSSSFYTVDDNYTTYSATKKNNKLSLEIRKLDSNSYSSSPDTSIVLDLNFTKNIIGVEKNSNDDIFIATSKQIYVIDSSLNQRDTIDIFPGDYITKIQYQRGFLFIQYGVSFYMMDEITHEIVNIFKIRPGNVIAASESRFTFGGKKFTVVLAGDEPSTLNHIATIHQFEIGVNLVCETAKKILTSPYTYCDSAKFEIEFPEAIDSIAWITYNDTIYNQSNIQLIPIDWSTPYDQRSLYAFTVDTSSCQYLASSSRKSAVSLTKEILTNNTVSSEKSVDIHCLTETKLSFETNIWAKEITWTVGDTVASTDSIYTISPKNSSTIYLDLKGELCSIKDSIKIKVKNIIKPEMCKIQINENGKNEVFWKTDFQSIDTVLLFTGSTFSNNYNEIGRLPASAVFSFADQQSIPEQRQYKYRIQTLDQCGHLSAPSDFHTTIQLHANKGINDEINLFWTEYVGADYSSYYLFKSIDGGNLVAFDSVSSLAYTYTDLNPENAVLKYAVGVKIEADCSPKKNSSFTTILSNERRFDILGVEESKVENLFRVDQINSSLEVLQPVRSIKIYNTKGQEIFLQNLIDQREFSLTNFSSGIYFVQAIGMNGQAVSKKIILQ